MEVLIFLGQNKVLTTGIVLAAMVLVGMKRGSIFTKQKGE